MQEKYAMPTTNIELISFHLTNLGIHHTNNRKEKSISLTLGDDQENQFVLQFQIVNQGKNLILLCDSFPQLNQSHEMFPEVLVGLLEFNFQSGKTWYAGVTEGKIRLICNLPMTEAGGIMPDALEDLVGGFSGFVEMVDLYLEEVYGMKIRVYEDPAPETTTQENKKMVASILKKFYKREYGGYV